MAICSEVSVTSNLLSKLAAAQFPCMGGSRVYYEGFANVVCSCGFMDVSTKNNVRIMFFNEFSEAYARAKASNRDATRGTNELAYILSLKTHSLTVIHARKIKDDIISFMSHLTLASDILLTSNKCLWKL